MNKIKSALASAKDNKVTIIKGTAVILGATVGLAIGMDLMNKAATTGVETFESLGDDEDSDDTVVVISEETD